MAMKNKIFDFFNKLLAYTRSMYTKGDLLILFLVCAFLQHAWALFLSFRDFDWITERTNQWDAVGNIAYASLIALADTIFLFLIILVMSLLVHKIFSVKTRLAIMSVIVLITSLWFIFEQGFYLIGGNMPQPILDFLVNSSHPYRIFIGVILILVISSFILPIFFILRSEKFTNGTISFLERISLLSGLYLFIDVIGIGIIIYRNVKGS